MTVSRKIITEFEEKKDTKTSDYYKKLLESFEKETIDKMAKIAAIISEETAIHIPEANKLPNGFEIEDAPYVLEYQNMKFTKKGLLLSDVEKILKLFCSPNFFLLPELPKKEDLPPLNFAFFIFSPVNAWSGVARVLLPYPYEENFNTFKRVIRLE